MRTNLNLKPVFFSSIFVNEVWRPFFSITIMGSYTSENNCSVQWRSESTGHIYMYDINGGLPDLASDGSPLFAELMFLFGWELCNTSTYYMLTFSLSCGNYALRGEFPFLHRLLQYIFTYVLFWLPRVNFSLKNLPPLPSNSLLTRGKQKTSKKWNLYIWGCQYVNED